MKTILHFTTTALILCSSQAWSQTGPYTNFIRQVQYPGPLERDSSCDTAGQRLSELAIDPGGARFELHTVTTTASGLVDTLLDSCYVGASIPVATIVIRTEDGTGLFPRTRADRPFYVDLKISGLLSGETDPEPSKSVNFLRHVQSYGVAGTGANIDRSLATLLAQSSITTNGEKTLAFALTSIPGGNRSKIRGEERFSVFSLEDYQGPESQLASQFIQVWPVADGTISGIANNQLLKFSLPPLTLAFNDLYPSSTTYAQVYKGSPVLGTKGAIVPGSAVVISDSIPQNRLLSLTNYDSVFTGDGRWTMEIVTVTPFGTDRLYFISFELDRTINMNTTVTTIE